ncbi:hypothetical protein Taro_004104 [Colocasia esculenta]|uniref:Uncharacterized protein n=1 Tax=Colocasia esculenta TaxID=4460 RepID=A0A843THB9_COLES|nr:hypothetical protein [Colocasia esculenta]
MYFYNVLVGHNGYNGYEMTLLYSYPYTYEGVCYVDDHFAYDQMEKLPRNRAYESAQSLKVERWQRLHHVGGHRRRGGKIKKKRKLRKRVEAVENGKNCPSSTEVSDLVGSRSKSRATPLASATPVRSGQLGSGVHHRPARRRSRLLREETRLM